MLVTCMPVSGVWMSPLGLLQSSPRAKQWLSAMYQGIAVLLASATDSTLAHRAEVF